MNTFKANHRKKLLLWFLLSLNIATFSIAFTELDLERQERALNDASEEEPDQDADIFVAEILPEGPENFEQIFRPLARYRKALIDTQIEAIDTMSRTENGDSEFVAPTEQTRDFIKLSYNPYTGLDSQTYTNNGQGYVNMQDRTGNVNKLLDYAKTGVMDKSHLSLSYNRQLDNGTLPVHHTAEQSNSLANIADNQGGSSIAREKTADSDGEEEMHSDIEISGSGASGSGESEQMESNVTVDKDYSLVVAERMHGSRVAGEKNYPELVSLASIGEKEKYKSRQEMAEQKNQNTSAMTTINNKPQKSLGALHGLKWSITEGRHNNVSIGIQNMNMDGREIDQGAQMQRPDSKQSPTFGENNEIKKRMGASDQMDTSELVGANEQSVNTGRRSKERLQTFRYIAIRPGQEFSANKDAHELGMKLSKDKVQVDGEYKSLKDASRRNSSSSKYLRNKLGLQKDSQEISTFDASNTVGPKQEEKQTDYDDSSQSNLRVNGREDKPLKSSVASLNEEENITDNIPESKANLQGKQSQIGGGVQDEEGALSEDASSEESTQNITTSAAVELKDPGIVRMKDGAKTWHSNNDVLSNGVTLGSRESGYSKENTSSSEFKGSFDNEERNTTTKGNEEILNLKSPKTWNSSSENSTYANTEAIDQTIAKAKNEEGTSDGKKQVPTTEEEEERKTESEKGEVKIRNEDQNQTKMSQEEAARKILLTSVEIDEKTEDEYPENSGSGQKIEEKEDGEGKDELIVGGEDNGNENEGRNRNADKGEDANKKPSEKEDASLNKVRKNGKSEEKAKDKSGSSEKRLQNSGKKAVDSKSTTTSRLSKVDTSGSKKKQESKNDALSKSNTSKKVGKKERGDQNNLRQNLNPELYHGSKKNDQRGSTGNKSKQSNFKQRKRENKKDLNFITKMMSAKARELYKNLIHDTSAALMSKKWHQTKRRHHSMRGKSAYFSRMPLAESVSSFHDQPVKLHYAQGQPETIMSSQGTGMTGVSKLKSLASNLLSTMVANDQRLVTQALITPIKSSQIFSRKGAAAEKLDNQGSLIEKLAELKFEKGENKKAKEIPLPEQENSEDTSLKGNELEDENPGKTVLQGQSKVGLGRNINLDNLDGSKQEYEYKLMDGKIEGESEVNERIEENNIGARIGKLSADQGNVTYGNISESFMKEQPTLAVYNEEEALAAEHQNETNDANGMLYFSQNGAKQKGGEQNGGVKLRHGFHWKKNSREGSYSGRIKQGKEKKTHPKFYFDGNSSLWKHHPVVSMNIDPLIDVFYKVNHENLIDLVEHQPNGEKKRKPFKHEHKISKIKLKIKNGEKTRTHGKKKGSKFEKETREKSRTSRKGKLNEKKLDHKGGKKKQHRKNLLVGISTKETNEAIKAYEELMQLHVNKVKTSKRKKYRKKDRKNKHHVFKHEYKLKYKKHVKGTAKFGISGVVRSPNPAEVPERENNMPANVKYYKIENAAKLGAVCIDGSIPGYYMRLGNGAGKKKWIIHLHGGAWCYDAETCFRRSKSILGSTKHWSAENITNFFQGILSDKREINPWFDNWNVVVQSYCDGGLFSGRRKEPLVHGGQKLYFRGRQILKAMVESLKRRDLESASDIILSGTSAGGLAVLLQGDYLRHKLPKTASVRGLIDAGFFLDSTANDGFDVIENQFRGLYEIHRPKLRMKCESGKDNSTKFRCLFPQNTVQHTKLPLFFVNALYDHWQLSELQRLRCIYDNDKCTPLQRDRILNFRSVMLENLSEALKSRKTDGIFADSCIGHGQAIVDYTWSRIKVNNQSLSDSFSNWINDRNGEKRHLNLDCHYPCNGSCPRAMVNSCVKNFKGATVKNRSRRNIELC